MRAYLKLLAVVLCGIALQQWINRNPAFLPDIAFGLRCAYLDRLGSDDEMESLMQAYAANRWGVVEEKPDSPRLRRSGPQPLTVVVQANRPQL